MNKHSDHVAEPQPAQRHGLHGLGGRWRRLDGYTLLHWSRSGMTFWAVSDVNEADLRTFQQLLQARTPA